MSPVHPNSLANLRPQQAGEPSINRKGHNQYTYRRDFEAYVEQIAKELDKNGTPNVEALARKAWALAMGGDKVAFCEVLARVWPKVEKHEHTGADGGPVEISRAEEWAELRGAMARVLPAGDGNPRINGNGKSAS